MFGLISNFYHDYILKHLRKNKYDKGYYIPKGGLFYFTNGANFFSEVVEWIGYAMYAGTFISATYSIQTFFNTFNKATLNHRYNEKKFGRDYTKLKRNIYIPFIY